MDACLGVEMCAECGFDGAAWTDADAVSEIAALHDRWPLAVDGLRLPDLLRRPDPSMWSIAEYVDHVREVLFRMRFLLDTALNSPGSELGDSGVSSGCSCCSPRSKKWKASR